MKCTLVHTAGTAGYTTLSLPLLVRRMVLLRASDFGHVAGRLATMLGTSRGVLWRTPT